VFKDGQPVFETPFFMYITYTVSDINRTICNYISAWMEGTIVQLFL